MCVRGCVLSLRCARVRACVGVCVRSGVWRMRACVRAWVCVCVRSEVCHSARLQGLEFCTAGSSCFINRTCTAREELGCA